MVDAKQARFRVVIGVDFSEGATHALYECAQFARLMPAVDLHFVHVVEAPPELRDPKVFEALSEGLERILIRLERYVRDALFTFGGNEAWGCDVAFHVRIGVPAREIHQVAVDVDAEMIVVGADHVSGLRKLFHRSTAEALVRSAHVPVVVAHQKNFRGLSRTLLGSQGPVPQEEIRGGLTSYSYVDFGESRRESRLRGSV